MQVRRAKPADKEELAKLLLDFYNYAQSYISKEQAQFRRSSNPRATSEKIAGEYISPDHIVFVADDNGDLKGLIVGEIKEKKYRVYNKEGFVEKWYVDKDYQSKGVGKELFERLVKEFKKEGCTHIALDTHFANTKARQIYEGMGFTKRLVTFFKPLKDL